MLEHEKQELGNVNGCIVYYIDSSDHVYSGVLERGFTLKGCDLY